MRPNRTATGIALGGAAVMTGVAVARRALRAGIGRPDNRLLIRTFFRNESARSGHQFYDEGTVWVLFGQLDLDLRRAEIGERVSLRVIVIGGVANITVPDTWLVDTRPARGPIRRSTSASDRGSQALEIRTTTIGGTVDVTARPVLRAADSHQTMRR